LRAPAKQSISLRKERMDCFVAHAPLRKRFAFVAGKDGRHTSTFPRRDAPECCKILRLENRGRRESRVPAAPAASRAKVVCTRVEATGPPETPGLPCAMVLTVSFVLSPVTGLFATVVSAMRKHCRHLNASIGASGPHDFAVRLSIIRPARIRVPDTAASTASHSYVRDDREPPLYRGGMAESIKVFLPGRKSKNFLKQGWTRFLKNSLTGKSTALFAAACALRATRKSRVTGRTVRPPRRRSSQLDRRHHGGDGEHHSRRDGGPDDHHRMCRCWSWRTPLRRLRSGAPYAAAY
jgi:hypothetical protein